MTAWIDLAQLEPNLALVNRLPAGLLHYYQVLPLAVDGERISVAMVYPGNQTAIAVLRELLGAEIVPVQTSVEAMQANLAAILPSPEQTTRLLLWNAQPVRSPQVSQMAAALAQAGGMSITELATPAISVSEVLVAAGEGGFGLAVLALPAHAPFIDLVQRANAPLLAVQPTARPLQRMLVVLRGFAADLKLVQWAAALAGSTEAQITLLPLATADVLSLRPLLDEATTEGRHLRRCIQLLGAGQSAARLCVRTGPAAQQIAAELAAHTYDLVALPAEGQGEFVVTALTPISTAQMPGALLLVKSSHQPNAVTRRHHPKRRL
jgi:hypothetical protein